MRKSRNAIAVTTAYSKGYRIDDNGDPISPVSGNVLKTHLKSTTRSQGYKAFSIRSAGRVHYTVPVHQLQAYQKFGEDALGEGIHVRHLDGNSLNNKPNNIAIGNQSDNMMDQSKEDRVKRAVNASSKLRKLTDIQIAAIRRLHKNGHPYSFIMKIFKIKSKGTMSHIINNKYQTKVM